jgi:hypothetical protein
MKTIIYNDRQLETVIADMCNKFREYGELSVDYGKPYKAKTKAQLGFIFGALVDSVIEFYKGQGVIWKKKDVVENFYSACSYMDERLREEGRRFNGDTYTAPKRLPDMSREEASIFIDHCIYLIDNAKCFKGLYLHPSIRNTWIRHVTQDDIDRLRFEKFPRTDKDYLHHQHTEPCLWCGKSANIQVHHLKELGYTGEAYKADDWLSLALCADCHALYHTRGKEGFMQAMKWITDYLSLVDFCKMRYIRWKNHL